MAAMVSAMVSAVFTTMVSAVLPSMVTTVVSAIITVMVFAGGRVVPSSVAAATSDELLTLL